MSNETKTRTIHSQDMLSKILFMFAMILLPLREVMVPREEIDPGPCPQSIPKLNYLPTLTLSQVLVMFRTWISYINKLIPWFQSMLKSTSSQVSSIYGGVSNIDIDFKMKFCPTKSVHLYHDHYMIDVDKKIYLYHHHYMIGILSTIHFKFAHPFNRKAVRFKLNIY